MSVAAVPRGLVETRGEVRNTGIRRALNHLAIFAILILAWELAVRFGWLDDLTTPLPSGIAVSFFTIYFVQANVWWHLFVTMVEALVGCFIGSTLGIGFAIAAGLSERFRRYIKPYIIVLQVTPRVAITPILIAWLGFGWSPKIAIAALICFFAPFVNTLTGMLNVDEEATEMFRSLGAKKSQIFWKLQLPNSLPIIMAGVKTAISLALAGAIVGEFVSANQGMAVLIHRYTRTLNMASSFAVLLTLTITGFVLYRLAEYTDHRIIFWRDPDRMAAVSKKRAAQWGSGLR